MASIKSNTFLIFIALEGFGFCYYFQEPELASAPPKLSLYLFFKTCINFSSGYTKYVSVFLKPLRRIYNFRRAVEVGREVYEFFILRIRY
jgi:hypothetical protein